MLRASALVLLLTLFGQVSNSRSTSERPSEAAWKTRSSERRLLNSPAPVPDEARTPAFGPRSARAPAPARRSARSPARAHRSARSPASAPRVAPSPAPAALAPAVASPAAVAEGTPGISTPYGGSDSDYDASLGPWEVEWSQAEITEQRARGVALAENITAALADKNSSYTIPPGTYRIPDRIIFEETVNFTLSAPGVELIVETETNHLFLGNNTNFRVQGPLTLDADPFGFTQGTIVGTDNKSYVAVRLMPGYPVPTKTGHRITFSTPQGVLLPLYQVNVVAIEQSAGDSGVYYMHIEPLFWEQYDSGRDRVLTTGNLISMELGIQTGGIQLGGNNGVELTDIAIHTFALIFAQAERGHIEIERLRGVRRPGTNRLNAGGFPLVELSGGSLRLRSSELGHNFDDLTDVHAGLSYAYNQTSPTEVYVGANIDPDVGTTLTFYDVDTLAPQGEAVVDAVEKLDPQDPVIAAFQEGLTNLGLLNWSRVPVRVTLRTPITMNGTFSLVDQKERRATSIIYENNYVHDGLAAGLNAKGANLIIIRNNVIERSSYQGASAGFDPYWWEGGVPANVLIEGNIIRDTGYSLTANNPAITTYVGTSGQLLGEATSAPIHNVTVRDNVIVNPIAGGIGLLFSASNLVANNTIVNPVAGVADRENPDRSLPFADAAAIFVDTVSGTTLILDNTIENVNRQVVPQTVRISNSTSPEGIVLCGNRQIQPNGTQELLPDEFWTSVGHDDPAVAYSEPFTLERFDAVGNRLNGTFELFRSSTPDATATFNFAGTRARWFTCVGPPYGTASILVDGRRVADVDASVVGLSDIAPSDIGFCDQMLFDTGALAKGPHTLTVVVAGKPGSNSSDESVRVAVEGFDYLKGVSACEAFKATPPTGFVSAPEEARGALSASGPQEAAAPGGSQDVLTFFRPLNSG